MASNTTTGPQEPTTVVRVTPTVRPVLRQGESAGTVQPRVGKDLPQAAAAPPTQVVHGGGDIGAATTHTGAHLSPPATAPRSPPAPRPAQKANPAASAPPAESAASLDAAIAQLNKVLNDSGRPTQYRVDRSAGTAVIQEVNPANGKVIAEISAQEFPALARSLGALGLFVDQHA